MSCLPLSALSFHAQDGEPVILMTQVRLSSNEVSRRPQVALLLGGSVSTCYPTVSMHNDGLRFNFLPLVHSRPLGEDWH